MTPPKRQTDLTFDEAKEAILDDLDTVIDYARTFGASAKAPAFVVWVTVLEGLRDRVRIAALPCLSERELKLVWDFAQALIHGLPTISFQLSQFWSLHEAVSNLLRSDALEAAAGFHPQDQIANLGERIRSADQFGQSVVRAAAGKSEGILAVGAVLMVHIARVDTIEYAIRLQLNQAVERFKLRELYDPVEICSVEEKIPCIRNGKQEWRTDVRAIRDAAAHFKFDLSFMPDDWSIRFSNHDHGYDFEKTLTKKEFLRFIDTHTVLYKTQLILLRLQMLLHVMTTHLWDGRSGR